MFSDFEIVSQESCNLAQDLASCFNKNIIVPQIKDFADTETFIKFLDPTQIKNKNIIVVQQFIFCLKDNSFLNHLNNQIFKFLLLVDYLKKVGAKKVTVVLPYLPYSRQEKTAFGNHAGAVFLLGKFLKQAGVDNVVSFDLHESSITSEFDVDLQQIKLDEFWANFLKDTFKDEISNMSLVSPDMGRIAMIKHVANLLGVNFAYIEKKRKIGSDESVALELVGDVSDNMVIIDDIIDTARTAVNACELLIKHGAKKIVGCFTHAVFSQGAIEVVKKSGFEQIFITDTVSVSPKVVDEKKVNVVSVKNVLCDYMKHMN